MIKFFNDRVTSADRVVQFSVDYVMEYKNESDENWSIYPPPYWDSTIAKVIDFRKFDCWNIYVSKVPHGLHNRITDYKKIWNLNCITPGFYDNYYDTPNARIYFGIKKEMNTEQLSKLSRHLPTLKSIILLTPKNINYSSWEFVFDIFRLRQYDLNGDSIELLKELQSAIFGSYLLEYLFDQNLCMNICVPEGCESDLLSVARKKSIP